MIRLLLLPILFASGIPAGYAQTDTLMVVEEPVDTLAATSTAVTTKLYHYLGEASVTFSSGAHAPFWLSNNRWGLSSIEKNSGYARAGFFRDMDYTRKFSWGFGVDLAAAYNYTSSFIIQQLYGEIRYRSLNLTIGSQEWTNGIVSAELSSGDMLFSQNSRPIPQARIEMPEYQPVPFTNRWLSVKGYFSMGMYTDGRWQRHYVAPDDLRSEHRLFHSKGLFLRGGDLDRFPLTFDAGLEMAAQWGGTSYSTNPYTGEKYVTHLPHGFKDMLKVIFPTAGGDSSQPLQTSELTNCYGNHVGQWSFALNYQPKSSQWGARLYYEHYFDDHSMLFFDHAWKDMLVGLELNIPSNPVISTFLYEYIVTKDQSGAVYWDYTSELPSQISGADNYYNQDLFSNWQHWGMGTGNPLLISPIYNADRFNFRHNRIKGHHFGWKGVPCPDVDYRVLLTYTRSWGSYFHPTTSVLHNFNCLIETNYHPRQLPGWNARLSLAADGGRLLGKSFGAMLTISKTGWL